MPAYNEEDRGIGDNIQSIADFLKRQPYTWELIVVDDGSRDATAAVVAAAADKVGVPISLLRNESNYGKGFSVRRGALAANGLNVFFTDADLSTPIEEINNCLPYLQKFDIVIGSRILPESNVISGQSASRKLMGHAFRVLARLVAAPGIKDIMCGFKGFTRQAATTIFSLQRLTGFAFDAEILYLARKLGYSIAERPITWGNRSKSRAFPVKEAFLALNDLAKIRINDFRGLYGS